VHEVGFANPIVANNNIETVAEVESLVSELAEIDQFDRLDKHGFLARIEPRKDAVKAFSQDQLLGEPLAVIVDSIVAYEVHQQSYTVLLVIDNGLMMNGLFVLLGGPEDKNCLVFVTRYKLFGFLYLSLIAPYND
jgi:hypothetical protein